MKGELNLKRVLCVLLFLALVVPVLLIPASAAEEYVFEWVNPEVMMLDESISLPSENDYYLYHDGLIPEGTYNISFYVSGVADSYSCYIEEPVSVLYSDVINGQLASLSDCILCVDLGSEFYAYPLTIAFIYGNRTICQFFDPETGGVFDVTSEFDYMVLTPVPPVPSLSDYIFLDSFDGILDEIIALLPVVMIVLIGYIGIRKGLAWIRDQLHGV